MKKIKKIPKSFQRALWSYDIDKMDAEKDRTEIITQVLNHGHPDDLKQLFEIYSEEEIKEVVKNPRRGVWFEKVLNFWTTVFGLQIEKDTWQEATFDINRH
ncbi:MAG: hypothetical protein CO001_04200 [Candidatus Portnoybacteria bacterium CG_4_8_14_3_um_filter_40_10]|uniref:DUF6922 domain-containing protein n=4 Tax=Candidatus Portnoyibacteriota TaxID=1817913 RepID=A0A2M7IHI0_9BACT|nr:MAG: hypothetical protein COV84_04200 [Candidatus Portnoybacteria bacterium CG11_big_fil_rev_8_21_14_0_20_40_15]PIS31528.1 MAG: hypothetical protein COT41_01495 [Candidatus Portnoybacteria bacterium CG08_land_8_20_14_0_20_40_83]PIW75908.1 MAG: hypothetical protein CO001_04200 [Candidatus Portnoybacteria bacterium CG_4_8_14_3_um_filter_40_10]PIY74110.1 MAG: hypothetical protein COY85_04150 [Candidatus Portnoybacteria bacterium CG_4_10_14_0_8_um_filter_40_50]PJA64915.1 MAG: hypothetical protei